MEHVRRWNMKNMQLRYGRAWFAALMVGLISPPVFADRNIGINFNNNDGGGAQTGYNTQGARWTDINPITGSVTATGGGFTVEWGVSNYWSAGSWNDGDGDFSSPEDKEISLYRAYLDDGDTPNGSVPADLGQAGDGIGVAVRLSGLAAWLATEGADGYRITVYCSTDQDPGTFQPVSVRMGGTLTSPVIETITPPVGGNGIYPSATGNLTAGTRGQGTFASFLAQDEIMITVASRNDSQRGTVAAIRVEALDAARSVIDAGGGMASVGSGTLFSAIGQGQPVGYYAGGGHQLYAGFLNTFLLHPALDTDMDGIFDENDPDDDNDTLADLTELAGSGFNPVTPSNPLLADSDLDGASDGEEAVAGTNPDDANSLLAVTQIQDANGNTTVVWSSRTGRQYRLHRGASVDELKTMPVVLGPYSAAVGGGPWQAGQTQAIDNAPGDRAVYRVEVVPAP